MQPIHYIPSLLKHTDRHLICYSVKSGWSISIPARLGSSFKKLRKKQSPIHECITVLNQIFSMDWVDSIHSSHRLHFMNHTEMILVNCDSVFWSQRDDYQ